MIIFKILAAALLFPPIHAQTIQVRESEEFRMEFDGIVYTAELKVIHQRPAVPKTPCQYSVVNRYNYHPAPRPGMRTGPGPAPQDPVRAEPGPSTYTTEEFGQSEHECQTLYAFWTSKQTRGEIESFYAVRDFKKGTPATPYYTKTRQLDSNQTYAVWSVIREMEYLRSGLVAPHVVQTLKVLGIRKVDILILDNSKGAKKDSSLKLGLDFTVPGQLTITDAILSSGDLSRALDSSVISEMISDYAHKHRIY
ncbi:hypothetical protein K2X30_02855 [bacterium]|nr:hypothetical protein [bacterium]